MAYALSLEKLTLALERACDLAQAHKGATAPNPPVGAVILDQDLEVLSEGAHQAAGEPHAEIEALENLKKLNLLPRAHTLVVTLEPCAHVGKTPPCVNAIISSGIKRVVFAVQDENPKVNGLGAKTLKENGVEVLFLETLLGADHPVIQRAKDLVRPFFHWMKTGLPWVTLKVARQLDGSMIPPIGKKTFTSPESLKLAHELRKRSNAILTGSGTVLRDEPLFTVRSVPDHQNVSRYLVIMDRRLRVPQSYFLNAAERGFKTIRGADLKEVIRFLGSKGCLEVLIEGGPTLLESIENEKIWNERVVITQHTERDEIIRDVYGNH